jgi:hypothetical protein
MVGLMSFILTHLVQISRRQLKIFSIYLYDDAGVNTDCKV